MNILHSIGAIFFTLSGLFGFHQAPPPKLSAALPVTAAVFETSLASAITSSATSMTLTANAVRGGGSIAGFTCFTVDEGSAQAETLCGTVASTAVTGLSRGISQSTGTTTVAALQFAHRRGANVKITDFPVIQILKAQNNGEDTFPNILNYTSHPTFISTTNLVDKKYVDDTAFSGAAVIDATTGARGVSQLATNLQTGSSTAQGSSGVLVIPGSNATDTPNTNTRNSRVLVSDMTGYLKQGWLDLTAGWTFSSTTVATSTVSALVIPSAKSYLSQPAWTATTTTQAQNSSQTTAWFYRFVLPFGITVNKFVIVPNGCSGTTAQNFAIYNESGTSRIWSGTVSAAQFNINGLASTSVSSLMLGAGNYYLGYVPGDAGTCNTDVWSGANDGNTVAIFNADIGQPRFNGTLTVSANTLPTTVTLSSLATSTASSPVFRLDN